MKLSVKLLSAALVLVMLTLNVTAAETEFIYDEIHNYYGSMSTDLSKEAYNAVLNAVKEHRSSVSLISYNVPADRVKDLYMAVARDNPSLFYLSSGFGYSTFGDKVYSMSLKYTMSTNDIDAAVADFDSLVDAVISTVPTGLDDMGKVLYIHDYIASHYEYDCTLSIYDAYTMLKSGSGVCQAYTGLFIVLMDKLGIEASWASSDIGNHTWNVVKLGDHWYHVDATHDDPTNDRFGMANHEFFLLSDATRSAQFPDMVCFFSCDDDSYESEAWLDTSSPLTYADGKWYGLYSDGIYEVDINSGDMTLVHKISGSKWPVWNKPHYSYVGSYSSLVNVDGVLYYNTSDKILSYDPSTGKSSTVYEADTSEGYIYGMVYSGDRVLTYNLSTEPGETMKLCTYTLPQKVMTGDLSGDGKLSSTDALILKRTLSGMLSATATQQLAGDVNKDGRVNSTDALMLKRALSGLLVLGA